MSSKWNLASISNVTMSEASEAEAISEEIDVSQEFVEQFCCPKKKQKIKKLLKGLKVETKVENSTEVPILAISGSIDDVGEAKMRVSNILQNLSRGNVSFTHLVTIPFNIADFIESFLTFKKTVLNDFSHCRGVDEMLFQNAKKLHLTVSVLALNNDEEISKAINVFRDECNNIFKELEDELKTPFEVRGLDIMNDNPTKTNVLYAKIHSPVVQRISNRINQQMRENGLLFKDKDPNSDVKLHVTFMNTLYLKRKFRKLKRANRNMQWVNNFDSTEILDHFTDYLFAETTLKSIQLNEARAENDLGFYKEVDVYTLPDCCQIK